jgi:hypothetical protein
MVVKMLPRHAANREAPSWGSKAAVKVTRPLPPSQYKAMQRQDKHKEAAESKQTA